MGTKKDERWNFLRKFIRAMMDFRPAQERPLVVGFYLPLGIDPHTVVTGVTRPVAYGNIKFVKLEKIKII
jgi:hypothetical protein